MLPVVNEALALVHGLLFSTTLRRALPSHQIHCRPFLFMHLQPSNFVTPLF